MTPELLRDIVALCDLAAAYYPGRDPLPWIQYGGWPALFALLRRVRALALAAEDHGVVLLIDAVLLRERLQGGDLRCVLEHVSRVLIGALCEDAFLSPPIGPTPYHAAMRRLLAATGGAP